MAMSLSRSILCAGYVLNRPEDHTPAAIQRERILSAARRVFLDGPAEQATMDAVAQAAGMSKKTIYREFRSQFDLLAQLLEENVAELDAFERPREGDDLPAALLGLLMRFVTYMTSPRSMALIRLMVRETRRYPDLAMRHPARGRAVPIIADWLRSPVVGREYQIDDPTEAAAMLVGMVTQDAAIRLLIRGEDPLPVEVIHARARRAVTIFLKGCRRETVRD
jgi:AcrR family transcriptional regulator